MATDISFALALPPTWDRLSLDEVRSDAEVWRRLAEAIPRGVGLDDITSAELSRTATWWIRQARKRGFALAATYAEPFDYVDDDGTSAQGALAAIMTLAFVHRSALGIDELRTLNPGIIIAALERSREPGWEPLSAPTRVQLLCGEAVERLRTAADDNRRVIDATDYVPLFGGDILAVASFMTPSLVASDAFIELFRSMMDTLEVFDDSPTLTDDTAEAAPAA